MRPQLSCAVLCLSILVACGDGAREDDDGEFTDPVADSEDDVELSGVDEDADGVRDDVAAYIATLEADPDKQAALTAFARESTAMMIAGGSDEMTRDAAFLQHSRVVRSIDCLAAVYSPEIRVEMIEQVGHALYNNPARLRAYYAADALLSGSILPSPEPVCDAEMGTPGEAVRRILPPPPAGGSNPLCGEGTAIYYGNGVNTTAVQADAIVRGDLPALADEARLKEPLRFGLAYNQTSGLFLDVLQTLEQKAIEDSRFSWFVINNALWYLLRGLNVPERLLARIPGGAELVPVLQEIINAAIADSAAERASFYDEDVADHVARYRADIGSGYRVVLIAHSQGTLYANAARSRLTLEDGEAALYFGAALVGNVAAVAPDGYVRSRNDLVVGLLERLGRTVPNWNVIVPVQVEDFLGHGFREIYINPELPARSRVVTLMNRISNRLPYNEVCNDPGLPTGIGVVSVAVSFYHACAVLADGRVQCWGANHSGALGGGLGPNSATPVTVEGLAGPALGVATGMFFSCAVIEGGTVQCWGDGMYGRLGYGSTQSSAVPVTVSGLSDATAVVAGAYHACALKADGTVVCWGSNYVGALGNGSTTSPTNSPVPLPVVGVTGATALSTGFQINHPEHTCALLSAGNVACWGHNYHGELGNGASFEDHVPYAFPSSGTAVEAIGVGGASAISTAKGIYGNTCAIVGGEVECWGVVHYDRLNVLGQRASPVPLTVPGLSDVTHIAGGAAFNCAVSQGQVSCWGLNDSGQLGDGTTTLSIVPVLVGGDGIGGVTQVSLGWRYACAVRGSGEILCWGTL